MSPPDAMPARAPRPAPPGKRGASLCLLLVLLVHGLPAAAHQGQPVYIEIREVRPAYYQLQWKAPPYIPLDYQPRVIPPDTCEATEPAARFRGADGFVQRLQLHCPPSLGGGVVRIEYPGPNPSVASLVRYTTYRGERHSAVLGPEQSRWTVPAGETAGGVAAEYLWLGMEHISSGSDHLLFLLGLLWIAGTWRRVLVTITGFTAAHSCTFVLSALGVVSLPVPPVEAAIALSIVFLATEVVKGPRDSLTWRYPVSVSSSFGLLHGFGFASALAAAGLPRTELAAGLLFFNLGVEAGQVAFIGAVIALAYCLRVLWRAAAAPGPVLAGTALQRLAGGYLMGAVAVFWLVQRCARF